MIERNLKKPLERLDGVARVQIAGVEPQEVRVLVDSGRMAAHGIDVRELVTLLERSNFSVSAGQITAAGQRLAVRPVGELRSVDEVGELLVRGNIRVARPCRREPGESGTDAAAQPERPPRRRRRYLQEHAG